MILNEPVERWPLCDCLISFHATDFPLHKAIEYERIRRPYVINDLHRQYDLVSFAIRFSGNVLNKSLFSPKDLRILSLTTVLERCRGEDGVEDW